VKYYANNPNKEAIHADDFFSFEGELGERVRVDKTYQDYYAGLSELERKRVAGGMAHLAEYFDSAKAITLTVDFSSGVCMLGDRPADRKIIEAVSFLTTASPILRMMDIRLDKLGYGDMSLRRASSGEQCMLIMLLGIAGHIENDSLVLIDEPEVSLHPRWQEEFMPLLEACFENYNRCHFVVATHSPQITSRLNSDNSFILSLGDGAFYSSGEFNKRSADYQLAVLFDAPGLMNEYVSRFCFNIIAKIKSRRFVDLEIQEDLHKLLELKFKLYDTDPVKDLIVSVEELCAHYASNK
jgi:hypothetical protein